MLHRKLWMTGALVLGGCGGLAADGTSAPSPWGGGCAGTDCSPPSTGPGGGRGFVAPDDDGFPAPEEEEEEEEEDVPRDEAARSGGAGDPCRAGAGERVRIGELVLEASADCNAGHLCMTWGSSAPDGCTGAADAPGCSLVDRADDVVPVPPVLAPQQPAVDHVCTCRCGGGPAGSGQCACPAGMTCRELIVSSGANGAAGEFVGSYCL